ncbi:hypothetical protein DCAR_0416297 [Daucus carota subsp. sativus]|uniref:Clp R domain-containing protein n=1 Tax=Daucus carota subsp. sativus TaxID=79200 RepID=A0AAF1AVI5_DAUCS|nr:PREDICTED: ATP-dependent Clp protease ATP-binding subunit CLPT1, chloroplastic [Daucus carota subsp. sativus]XP_017247201.1 PREDICTED: ATP-dependent Clp protease ATP-binding subunit CLPT1, chloroplastic [Daucus carota subsp. sativus]XP_017247202.1 PREDICTED: ATP-dependent Clp protease ATP-binding subunit CLPT1, chloroplastic [Daucus carota subsp. sativus]WOG96958.1 hypothetical protein DCAR_0416297 [Daucus carota subsp. sativus]
MAAHALSLLPISTPSRNHFCCKQESIKSSLCYHLSLASSFVGAKLAVNYTNSRQYTHTQHSSTVATISVSLPTGTPDRISRQKSPKWSARAIKSYAMAELEARKLKYPNTGTEALLMGILVEGTSLAAKFLRENGITLFKVRDETVKLLGKSDMYFFSPEHPPFTEPAQRALDWAIAEKLKSGEDGEVTAAHFLLGVWSEKESAGHKIMAALGFDDEKAKEVAKFMDKDIDLGFKTRS